MMEAYRASGCCECKGRQCEVSVKGRQAGVSVKGVNVM